MSIESFSPLPLNVFGTWVTLLDPSDVPAGMSPSLGDVEFFAGGVRTRPGLVSQFSVLTGTPQINGVKTYATSNLIQRFLALDSLGDLYKESTPGVLGLAASGVIPNALMASATQFGREYMAFSDGLMGQDLPRQYYGLRPRQPDWSGRGAGFGGHHRHWDNFPRRAPVLGNFRDAPRLLDRAVAARFLDGRGWKASERDEYSDGSVERGAETVGVHGQWRCNFLSSAGDDDDQRQHHDVAGGGFHRYDSAQRREHGLLVQPSRAAQPIGVVPYVERLFWWGGRAKMDNWRNLSFDGGWDASGNGRPLGWILDSPFGGGATREPLTAVWGDAFRIVADGLTAERGYISQNAITDVNGDQLLLNNTDYSVRVRIARSAGLSVGTLRVNAFSPTAGQIATGIAVTAMQVTAAYAEFTVDLFTPQTALPADLTLRVYADGVPGPSGESFYVDCIEVFPTNAAQNASLVRASSSAAPKSYDGVTGIQSIAENNGQGIRAAFTLRNNLYFAKERSLYVTATDGVNEPAL
jgi:hypothetical protein